MQPDLNNVETPDWIAGGSALLLFIALFLPWVRVSTGETGVGKFVFTGGASFGWICILSVLVVMAAFVVTLLDVDVPFPVGLVYLGAGGLATLITVLMMLVRPISLGLGIAGHGGIPWYGSFIALIAGVGILVGGWLKFNAQK